MNLILLSRSGFIPFLVKLVVKFAKCIKLVENQNFDSGRKVSSFPNGSLSLLIQSTVLIILIILYIKLETNFLTFYYSLDYIQEIPYQYKQ